MSRDERYGTRDLTFSAWHRYGLPGRATAIDLDLVEYCQRCRMPLCLIESARDVGQPSKPTIVMRQLAQVANVVAICLLWTPDGNTCQCKSDRRVPGCRHGISGFRMRRIHPVDEEFEEWKPGDVAAWLTRLHDNHEEIACRYRKAG